MTETAKPEQSIALLNAYVGKVDPASIEEKTSASGKPYVVAKLDVESPEKTVDIYVHGEKRIAELKEKIETGAPIFVQGETLAAGKGISVGGFEPKTYTGTIEKIHASGRNDYGDWAAVRMDIGLKSPRNIMLSGQDALDAVAAGEGSEFSFQGAWKPEKNPESGNWYSKLVSASSLGPRPESRTEPAAEEERAPTP